MQRHAALIMIASLLLLLLFPIPASVEPLGDAAEAFSRGDYETAYRLIKPSAEQGLSVAQFNLGILYENGLGVPQDYAEAVKWYRKAAEQGHVFAQCCLGVMYVFGQGVPQDYILAHLWLNLAISRFPASERERREDAENGREYLESLMTPDQVAEAQKLARDWKPKKLR